jgi:hypothetical protein
VNPKNFRHNFIGVVPTNVQMQLFTWANNDELVSAHNNDKQPLLNDSQERSASSAPFDEERYDVKMGRNFDLFMNYICFPEDQMDYICFPEDNFFRLSDENIECIVEKENQDERLGISIRKHPQEDDGIFVSKIDPAGKFAFTDLKPGMKILSVNDEPCPPTITETIAVLKLAKSTVKIVAEPRDMDDSPIADDAPRDKSPVEESTETSRSVSLTDLFCGINDTVATACGHYEQTITNSVDYMIDSMIGSDLAPAEQTSQIHKNSKDEKLGIALMQSKSCNDIYVNHVWEGSKFAAAGLQPGVKVLRINGAACPETLDQTVAAMNDTAGDLQLIVIADEQFCHELEETLLWNGNPIANKVVARIEKSKDEPIGMLLRKYPNKDGIFVSKIAGDGKAASTQLKAHMKVLLINDQTCPQEMEDCTQLITKIDGELKIVAVAYIPQELIEPAEA